MYKGQFLLTIKPKILLEWQPITVGNYYLYRHHSIDFTFVQHQEISIYLLGSLYDWATPSLSNKQILQKLLSCKSKNDFFDAVSKYNGQYILIYQTKDDVIIMNDACSQAEIYYDDTFSHFASQPKLLLNVVEPIQHDISDAITFYESNVFRKKALFVGESTHIKNIKHLLPNHYISLKNKYIKRFFPILPRIELPLDEIAQKASSMIKGYIKAISLRNNIAMAVTGGYDSRVLFLASLEINCQYYVAKHPNMTDEHYDISIPKKLTALFNKNFRVIPDKHIAKTDYPKNYIDSVDFPRFLYFSNDDFENCVFINGNISEIARNYFGYHKNITAGDLSFLNGFGDYKYPIKQYDNWLENNKENFNKLGYHLLDMFYWEEKMGTWAAKAKTEYKALGKIEASPFNSRELLTLLLSSKRKDRDSHFNKLYNRIIYHLSNNNKKVLELPINPSKKQDILRWMKRLKIYNLYRYIGVKTRKLKV